MEPEELLGINGQLDRCLTGKLLSNRPISKVAIKNALSGAWKTRESFEVEVDNIGKNMFMFNFEDIGDRKWILNNGPWLFNKNVRVLETPIPNLRTTELDLKEEAFWVRLFNLPMGYRNKKAAKRSGNNLGKFIEVDCGKDELCWDESLRIKVLIDITVPLCRGFMLKEAGASEECWVTLRYERLPEFCFK